MKTLHLISMPHTQATIDYTTCAYTTKLRNMAIMMSKLGYKVHVYASEDYDFEVTGDLVTCITKEKQYEFFGDNDHKKTFYNITWGPEDAHWKYFNANAIKEISKRYTGGDIIGHFSGWCEKEITDAFPDAFGVELGIGYTGTYSPYRVYESYSHMHWCMGNDKNDNGNFYYTVIPGYHDKAKFKAASKPEDYFLYVGRLITRKGYSIAQEVSERLGKRLIIAGQMDVNQEFEGYGEYIGTVDEKQRNELMNKAIAVFTPSLYIEPFGNVHVEALMSGAPVISTNFGVYTETIQNDFNGQRCDDFQEFVNAAYWAQKLPYTSRIKIQEHAFKNWSTEVVAKQYDQYFQRLYRLNGRGWYEEY